MEFIDNLDRSILPKHIAIIMDGNGRWAKNRSQPRVFGHTSGVESVRQVTEGCAELGIEYLTLYAFSTENWNRPAFEVNALMHLLVDTIRKEINTLNKNNIRLKAIGGLDKLPSKTLNALQEGIEKTSSNTGLTLILALNYSAKWEIVNAIKNISSACINGELTIDNINDSLVDNFLSTQGIPDPELLIRTSGEHRISNFLLWQLAYSELYFTDVLWPDFRKPHLHSAIKNYQGRERRFGKTSEQINNRESDNLNPIRNV